MTQDVTPEMQAMMDSFDEQIDDFDFTPAPGAPRAAIPIDAAMKEEIENFQAETAEEIQTVAEVVIVAVETYKEGQKKAAKTLAALASAAPYGSVQEIAGLPVQVGIKVPKNHMYCIDATGRRIFDINMKTFDIKEMPHVLVN